jgi:ATP-binding cassette, subfamily B (MDR/TAP), member 1
MFFGIGCGAFLFSYLQTALWVIVGERIVLKLRALYFEKLLRQDIAFYDATQSGMLISRLSADIMLVQAGCSDKLATAIQYAAQILGGVVVAFIYGWKMTLVMVACSPVIALAGAIHARLLAAKSAQGQTGYASASDVASEAIGGVRTVYSFVAEETMMGRYLALLNKAYKEGVKRAHIQGTGLGSTMLFMFSVYALGFWYGGKLVTDREMKAGDVLVCPLNLFCSRLAAILKLSFQTVFFAIIMSAMGTSSHFF